MCPEILVRRFKFFVRGYCRESGDTCPLAGVISFHPVPYMVILSPWKLPYAMQPVQRTQSTSGLFQAPIFMCESLDFARGAASWGRIP